MMLRQNIIPHILHDTFDNSGVALFRTAPVGSWGRNSVEKLKTEINEDVNDVAIYSLNVLF